MYAMPYSTLCPTAAQQQQWHRLARVTPGSKLILASPAYTNVLGIYSEIPTLFSKPFHAHKLHSSQLSLSISRGWATLPPTLQLMPVLSRFYKKRLPSHNHSKGKPCINLSGISGIQNRLGQKCKDRWRMIMSTTVLTFSFRLVDSSIAQQQTHEDQEQLDSRDRGPSQDTNALL